MGDLSWGYLSFGAMTAELHKWKKMDGLKFSSDFDTRQQETQRCFTWVFPLLLYRVCFVAIKASRDSQKTLTDTNRCSSLILFYI